MGSSSSTQTPSRLQFDPRPWTLVGEGENYSILRNNSTGEELEQYLHTATDAKAFDHLKNMFQYRLEKDYIVSSRFFRQESRNQMCSTFFQGYIYTERIPLRMNQIKDLPFPDTLHLVNSVLRGFRELYAKMGPFEVNQHMVGINGDARVKVWLSQDFGRDRPDDQAAQMQERTMVTQIIQMVDKNIDRRTQPESITNTVLRNGSPTFEQALMLVSDYTVRHLVSVPPFLASIAELRQRGFFKKMLPKGRSSVGSINVPLHPSINRSLALASRSMIQANNQQIPPVNWNVPIPNPNLGFLPTPTSVTVNQPILTTYPPGPQQLLSPLSIPLAEASSQRMLLQAQNYNNQPINRVLPASNQLGVPQTQLNHLQFVGKEPLMSLNQNYPPPADYSVLNPPPSHLRGHKTEVKSWISPPIERQKSTERLVERQVRGVSPARQVPQPLTVTEYGSQVNYPKTPIAPIINRSPMVPVPVSIPGAHFPTTETTTQQRTVSFGVDNHNYNYNQNHNNIPNNVIVIPNKIQLTLTSLSNSGPFGASSETFVIAPNQSNMHSGLIKEIINHTLGLQSCLKEGAYHNPTVINTFYQDTDNDVKALSQATTSNFSDHGKQERYHHYNSYETPQRGFAPLDGGYTDPTLLRTMKILASAIDSQTSGYNYEQPRYNTVESYTVKTSTFDPINHNSWNSGKSQNSSPQIMAIISQALDTGRRQSHKKTSYVSDVQSVDFDSRHGSAIRS